MTFNLFNLTHRVARELGGVVYTGLATGGSTTTLIDTVKLGRWEDDFFNKVDLGTVWILRDAGGASAAPEGQYATVSDFVSATKTATISTVTAAVGAGDRYAIADDKFPLHTIIDNINMALLDMGNIIYTDTTTVQIDVDQTEYTLPAGLAGGDLDEVWLQTADTNTDDNRWKLIPKSYWYVQKSVVGTEDELVFTIQLAEDYYCKLVYDAPHPELYVYTDELSEHVPLQRVIYPAALNALRWKKQDNETDIYDDQILKLEMKTAKALREHPIRIPKRTNKGWVMSGASAKLESEPNKVYL